MAWTARRWCSAPPASSSVTTAVTWVPSPAARCRHQAGCAAGTRPSRVGSRPVGLLAALAGAHVSLDQLPVTNQLDQPAGGAGVDVAADQPPRHRVQPALDGDVTVGR